MNAGRELDALIAEKVMGHHTYEDSNPKGAWHTQGDTVDHPCKVCGDFYGHGVPTYSTDIAAAWEVFALPYFDAWAIGRRPSDQQFEVFNPFEGKLIVSVGKTAPHAICLAALKAVERF